MTPYLPQPVNWAAALNRDLIFWSRNWAHQPRGPQAINLATGESKQFNAYVNWGRVDRSAIVELQGTGSAAGSSELQFTADVAKKTTDALTILAVWEPTYFGFWNCLCSSINGGTQYWILRGTNSGPKMQIQSTEFAAVTGATSLTAGRQWHIAATVGTRNGVRVYLDGKLDGSGSYNGASLYNTQPFRLFGYQSGSASGHGYLRDMRIFARELDPDEIAAQIAAEAAGWPCEINWSPWSLPAPPPPALVPLPGLDAAAWSPAPVAEAGGLAGLPGLPAAAWSPAPVAEAGGLAELPALPAAAWSPSPIALAGGLADLPALTVAAWSPPPRAAILALVPLPPLIAAAWSPAPVAEAGGLAGLPGLPAAAWSPAPAVTAAGLADLPALTVAGWSPSPIALAGGLAVLPPLAAAVITYAHLRAPTGLFYCARIMARPSVSARLAARPSVSARLAARPALSAFVKAAVC